MVGGPAGAVGTGALGAVGAVGSDVDPQLALKAARMNAATVREIDIGQE